jgi:hypothetical protein
MSNADSHTSITAADLILKNKTCLNEVEKANSGFYYFTTLRTAERILSGDKENYILVSPISRMNDLHERELHATTGTNVFGLCFCNSDMDNIPMWYLYSGISGQGARIGITAKRMHSLLESIKSIYAVENNQIGQKLELGIDFELEYGWIYYRNADKLVKYRNQYYTLADSLTEFEQDNYLVKDMEWNYEKEFRIVFHIKNTPPERIAVPIQKQMLMKNGGLTVRLAPELRPACEETLAREMYAQKFGLPEEKIKFSKLKIKMDLIARNQFTIVEKFSDVINNLNYNDVANICTQMQSRNFCFPPKPTNENVYKKTESEELTYV